MSSQYFDGISVEFVRACFRYDHETGKMFWKVKGSGRSPHDVGDEAGGNNHATGYVRVQIFGRMFFAHRVIWAIVHGVWPGGMIDHVNGKRDDNRIENLRLASHAENMRNAKAHSDSASGFRGVSFMAAKRRWRARIKGPEGEIHLGLFLTKEDAAEAYDTAARQYFGEFARTNFSQETELV